jgi:hypothetical protein
MKHQNYTQNFEVDGPYKSDIRISFIDCVMIFLAGVTIGLITALIATGN